MTASAVTVRSMGFEVSILLWIGVLLLVVGLFFALAGRRPARRQRKQRDEAARIGAEAAARRHRIVDE